MLRLDGVTRHFGRVAAVQDMTFDVSGPGVVGLLGPNGAGKTTTMRLIAGALMPSAGEVRIEGCRLRADTPAARRRIGWLPETPPLYGEMTVLAYLDFVARLRGLRGSDARRRVLAVAEECAIAVHLPAGIASLSRGQRQRVGLAQAIVHDPALLVLDEPTSGLDPAQLVKARQLIERLGRDRTILLSTHNLHEAEALCRRILFIRGGRLVADRTIGDVPAAAAGTTIRLTLRDPVDAMAPRLAEVDGVRAVHVEGGHFLLDIDPGADPNQAIVALVHRAGWTLLGFHAPTPGLEELFLRHGEPGNDA